MNAAEGAPWARPPLEQMERRALLAHHVFQQGHGWIYSLIANGHNVVFGTARGCGSHFGLVESGASALTLPASRVSCFVCSVFFSLWFEIRTEARTLPSSADERSPDVLSKQLHWAELSSVWETSAGLAAQAGLLPSVCSSPAEADIFVFHLVWAFREKSVGKPSWPFSYGATCI